jgi:hypothetical protein
MQRRSVSIIRGVDDSSSVNEAIDDSHLVLWIPDTSRSWPRITHVMKGRGSAPIGSSRVRASNQQKLYDTMFQRCRSEVEGRITDVKPVGNALNQTISRDGVRNQVSLVQQDLADG